MYRKIPNEIKHTERLAKITYANSFDTNFFLLLRERRSTTLENMHEAAFEVESNILAAESLKKRSGRGK